ncbi:MAG: glycosyltransferase family 2 protein [Magnetococcales bacterium]|nr:glycosyltransferase family 2 protein [Magnetococcales bacterium]
MPFFFSVLLVNGYTKLMKDTPHISIIIPAHNEEAIIASSLATVINILVPITEHFDIIVVDDGSQDETAIHVQHVAASDSRVHYVSLSRCFGKEAALAAGLEVATGQAVILMDADMQHPPSLIPDMIKHWQDGYDIVDAIKAKRGKEGASYRLFAKLFYMLLGDATGKDMSRSSDFKLLDRQVVDVINSFPERNRFFRGLVAWVGYRSIELYFNVEERLGGGKSKWSTWNLIKYSANNIIAFSSRPLILIAWIGLFTVISGIALGLHTLYNYFIGIAADGFTTIILLIIIIGGAILCSLGVIAVYLSKVYDEQKSRPLFIIRKNNTEQ